MTSKEAQKEYNKARKKWERSTAKIDEAKQASVDAHAAMVAAQQVFIDALKAETGEQCEDDAAA